MALETNNNYNMASDLIDEVVTKLTTSTAKDQVEFKGCTFEMVMSRCVMNLRERKREKFHQSHKEDGSLKDDFADNNSDLSESEKEKILQEELETVVLKRCMD